MCIKNLIGGFCEKNYFCYICICFCIFFFFLCRYIRKNYRDKIGFTPPLASANTFFNFSTPGDYELKESHTVLEAHAFAFLCRPIQEVETPPGISSYYQGEPYESFGIAHRPFKISFDESTTFLAMMNVYKKFQESDPNNEIICFTGVSNIKNSDTVTITLPPINKGTEFFIVVYVMQKLQSGGDAPSWSTQYRFQNVIYDAAGLTIPQKIIASENFQEVLLTSEVPSM